MSLSKVEGYLKKQSALSNQQSAKTFSPQRTQRTQRRTGLPLINADEEAVSTQQSAVSQNLFTAKDAEDAKENGLTADQRG